MGSPFICPGQFPGMHICICQSKLIKAGIQNVNPGNIYMISVEEIIYVLNPNPILRELII